MPANSYSIDVNTPCIGDQRVDKVSSTHYTGSNGDFTYAVLTRAPNESQWIVRVYDYRTGSNCNPFRDFEQVTPDADDPSGVYSEVGSGTGEAAVTSWP